MRGNRNETLQALLHLLQSPQPHRRCLAAQALGRAGARAVLPQLVERLWDEDLDVCHDAAQALGRLGDRKAVPGLCDFYRQVPFGDLKVAAVEALGAIGGKDAVTLLLQVAREKDAVWADVEDEDWDDYWDAQRKAVQALGRLGAKQAMPIVRDLLLGEDGLGLYDAGLECLAALGAPGMVALAALLDADAPELRRRAVAMLGNLGEAGDAALLLNLLDDPEPGVRAEVLEGLLKLGAVPPLEALLACLEAPETDLRRAAIAHLALLPVGDHAPHWANLLTDREAGVRAGALAVLAPLRLPSLASYYKRHCHDPGLEVRLAALSALELLGDSEHLPHIRALLDDACQPPAVQVRAVQCIAALGSADARQILLEALAAPTPAVRLRALTALVEGERDSALALLLAALRGELVAREEEAPSQETPPEAELSFAQVTPAAPQSTVEALQRITQAPLPEHPVPEACHLDPDAWKILGGLQDDLWEVEQMQRLQRLPAWLDVRVLAAGLLGGRQAPEALEDLLEALQVPEPALQIAAAGALEALAEPRAVEPLETLLQSPHTEVRLAALRALGCVQTPRARAALLAMWPQKHALLRSELVRALCGHQHLQCEEAIAAALEDGEPAVVRAAVDGLLARDVPGPAPPLLAAMGRHAGFDWRGVGSALRRCGPDAFRGELLAMLAGERGEEQVLLAAGLLTEQLKEHSRPAA